MIWGELYEGVCDLLTCWGRRHCNDFLFCWTSERCIKWLYSYTAPKCMLNTEIPRHMWGSMRLMTLLYHIMFTTFLHTKCCSWLMYTPESLAAVFCYCIVLYWPNTKYDGSGGMAQIYSPVYLKFVIQRTEIRAFSWGIGSQRTSRKEADQYISLLSMRRDRSRPFIYECYSRRAQWLRSSLRQVQFIFFRFE